MIKENKEVENIVINFKDGTQKKIKKGIVSEVLIEYDEDVKEEMLKVSMDCCNVSGEDMINYFYSVMSFLDRMKDEETENAKDN